MPGGGALGRLGASWARSCSLCSNAAARPATAAPSWARAWPVSTQRAGRRPTYEAPYSTASIGSWAHYDASPSWPSSERSSIWGQRFLSSNRICANSNMDLDPRGVDASLFEDPSDDYEGVLEAASASAGAGQGPGQAHGLAMPASVQVIAGILLDATAPLHARLDSAAATLEELRKLDTHVPDDSLFAVAAEQAAEDVRRIQREIADWRTGPELSARLHQVLAWLALAPPASAAPGKEQEKTQASIASAMPRIVANVLRVTESPALPERDVLAQLAFILARKGWLDTVPGEALFRQAFGWESFSSATSAHAKEQWLAWCDSVLQACRDASARSSADELPSCLQLSAEDLCAAAAPQVDALSTRLVEQIFLEDRDKFRDVWLGHVFTGGRHGITPELIACVTRELDAVPGETAEEAPGARGALPKRLPTDSEASALPKRFPTDSEAFYGLRFLLKGISAGRTMEAYRLWKKEVQRATTLGGPTGWHHDMESESLIRVRKWPQWAEALRAVPAPPAIKALTAPAHEGDPQHRFHQPARGFGNFLAHWAHLYRQRLKESRMQPVSASAQLPPSVPRWTPNQFARMVMQDSYEMRVQLGEREWSMILNASISEGRRIAHHTLALACALGVVRPPEDIPRSPSEVLALALAHSPPPPQASLPTRISALQACLHVRKEEEGRMLGMAAGIFQELWACICTNESLDRLSPVAVGEALDQFWADILGTNERKPRDPSFKDQAFWEGPPVSGITRRSILTTPRAVRVLVSYYQIALWHAGRKGTLDPKFAPGYLEYEDFDEDGKADPRM